jgi:hypothetical protein
MSGDVVLEQPVPVLVNVLWSNTGSSAFMSRNQWNSRCSRTAHRTSGHCGPSTAPDLVFFVAMRPSRTQYFGSSAAVAGIDSGQDDAEPYLTQNDQVMYFPSTATTTTTISIDQRAMFRRSSVQPRRSPS